MKKKGFISFIFVFFLIILVTNISAETLGTRTQDSTISLHQICRNCTYVNLTSITFPNGTLRSVNLQMTKQGFDYNLTFSETQKLGVYQYNTCGDLNGVEACENIDFTINPLGEELTIAKAIIYIFLTVMLFILFLFLLWLVIIIPYNNEVNAQGHILAVTKKKYIKLILIPITYAVFVWFLNLLLSMASNLLDGFIVYSSMISFVFVFFVNQSLIFFVVCLVWIAIEMIRDINYSKQIKKLGKVVPTLK